jgi:Ca2+-binding EF-hand superfamily protein
MKKTFLSLGLKEHERLDSRCPHLPTIKKDSLLKRTFKSLGTKKFVEAKKNELSMEMLNFLHGQTQLDREDIGEWYQGFLKDCPGGKLDGIKFSRTYSKLFPAGNAAGFAEHLFRTMDCDRNGYIDFPELMIALHVQNNGTPEEKLNLAFAMYDKNENQHIEPEELKSAVEAVYEMLNKKKTDADTQATSIFGKMDTDNDGTISKDEFNKICLQDAAIMKILSPKKTELAQLAQPAQPDQRAPAPRSAPLPAETEKLIISLYENLSKLIKHHL